MRTSEEIWGIVLAAGAGSRFGGRKQFLELGDRRLVDHSVSATASVTSGLVLVLPEGTRWDGHPATVVAGGETRTASVRSGLASVPSSADIIVIHDAVHPLASKELFETVLETVRQPEVDAVVPVLPATDTLARVRDEQVIGPVSIKDVVSFQVPQAFKAAALRAAHQDGEAEPDDSMRVQQLGATVRTVPGEPSNIHITTAAELAVAEKLLSDR